MAEPPTTAPKEEDRPPPSTSVEGGPSGAVAADFWQGRRVLVTGHTGFKGAWLSLWLHRLGANVHGLALDPPTSPSLFEVAKVSTALASDSRVDIRNQEATCAAFERVQPEAVFHMAAQTLVRHSYRQPVDTYAVNVMGTAHILE